MSRDTKKVFSNTYTTFSRREFIDADYINKLSEEEKEFYARFIDEYYGASFTINPTYVKYKDCIKVLKTMIKTEENPKKKEKFENQLEHYLGFKGEKHVQISRHKNKNLNLDLRKFRSTRKYYMNTEGKLKANDDLKYSEKNVHKTKEERSKCNHNVNSNQRDIMSIGFKQQHTTDTGLDLLVDNHSIPEIDHEKKLILDEEIKERRRIKEILKKRLY